MPYYFITFKIERISQIWNKVCLLLLFMMCSAPTSKCGQESVHTRADRDGVIKIRRKINRFVTLCWIKYRVNLTLMEKKETGPPSPSKTDFFTV